MDNKVRPIITIKEAQAKYQKVYRKMNPEFIATYNKYYYEKNKEGILAYQKKYREAKKNANPVNTI